MSVDEIVGVALLMFSLLSVVAALAYLVGVQRGEDVAADEAFAHGLVIGRLRALGVQDDPPVDSWPGYDR